MNTEQQGHNNIISNQQQNHINGNEISLIDIACMILLRRKMIISVAAIVTIIGIVYAFSVQRIYRVESVLLPPTFENIQVLNVENVNEITAEKVYLEFTNNFKARSIRKEFFKKASILDFKVGNSKSTLSESAANSMFDAFSNNLRFIDGNRVVLDGIEKDKIGVWLDEYVDMVNRKTIESLVRNAEAKINIKKNAINSEISSKRAIYKQIRKDEMSSLDEAYRIAKNLGIHEHLLISRKKVTSKEKVKLLTQLSSITIPNYMKGTKLLKAEINILKGRTFDDGHIDGLRDLQEKLSILEAIKIDKTILNSVVVDKKATVKVEPVSPNRRLILIISLVFAVFLGVFSAIVAEFFSKVRSSLKEMQKSAS